ncbi:tetratricopeptide repeat protein, partial [Streptomyces sp. GC420]|uniref:ATP-binding protein n=1 Tax=Streptomyces sp. GC420 TaxID=2697568 RepID=UPI0014152085
APVLAPVPAQLPADLPAFVGREALLSEAERLVTGGEPGTAAVVVGAVAGTAGVGKTAFAVRWAHRVAHRFPDGRLYLNLRGFDPAGPPVTPEQALRTAMEAFGLAPQTLPQDVDALAARWRTLLSGRRVLLLLDNARDSRQVRPLLPGRPGCLVIVTSRNRLTGLVAADGAHPFHLDVLSPGESRELLERRVGAGRVAAEPEAVEAIVEECARLPLALSVAAARAVVSPGFPLAAVAEELRGCRDGTEGLDAFSDTEPGGAADIRAVFSWSYQALTPAAARLFRLLAVHPGSCIALPAAASLAGLPAAGTRRLVAELVGAHLLYEPLPGRFTTHDLLRAYAGELARALDTPAEREAARRRILDHYLHSAHSAGQGYSAHRQAIVLPPPVRDVRPEEFADCEEGGAWFAAEQAVLVAAVEQAAAHGFDRHTWQLAWAVAHHLDRRGLWHDLERTQRTAMDAAVRTGDPVARAHAHRGLGRAATELGRVAEARAHMERATELFAGVGDSTACAESHRQASWVAERQGDLAAALGHARRALAIHRDNGDAVRLAAALNAVGWCHTLLGQHREALDHCQAALMLQQRHKQPYGEADTWDSIGYAHHRLGQYGEAVTAYQNALAAYRTIDVAYGEADTLGRLGDTYLSTGRPERARATWTEALAILERLGHADAGSVRARLRKLGRD